MSNPTKEVANKRMRSLILIHLMTQCFSLQNQSFKSERSELSAEGGVSARVVIIIDFNVEDHHGRTHFLFESFTC